MITAGHYQPGEVSWSVVCVVCEGSEGEIPVGLEFGKSQRAVDNREKWRKLVAKSSVVP